jgi:hypothetical protein
MKCVFSRKSPSVWRHIIICRRLAFAGSLGHASNGTAPRFPGRDDGHVWIKRKADTSLTKDTPAASAACATRALVSIGNGCACICKDRGDHRHCARDLLITSTVAAPDRSDAFAADIGCPPVHAWYACIKGAASGANPAPSEKLSGVTFRMLMILGPSSQR